MDNCIFCKIAGGEIVSYVIKETPNALAILDTQPGTEGHTLIIPKQHVSDVSSLSTAEWQELGGEIMGLAHEITLALKAIWEYEGYRIFANGGIGQEYDHLHFHVYGQSKDQELNHYKVIEGKEAESLKNTQKKFVEFFESSSKS